MHEDDLFTVAKSNVPELSVSDLAQALKRTLEQNFSHIRVRGELSGVKIASSGHLYGDIKDVNAVVNIVCWRGTLSKFSMKPEDGMDVIVTGRVTSYEKSSRYQIVIEQMELAGEGALLKLLEERRKKLAAEGLFDAARKKPLPFLPQKIGVITSPTGAVIRDIMHRLRDRFPSHVMIWPVMVQGQGAAEQIAAAIRGLNALPDSMRPDLLIVARGGGSLEDLMPFQEEIVVRAVADSLIPLISAVGHETDTTLIDYAADVRAPTPTAAAEIAVPVRMQLMAQLQTYQERLIQAMARMTREQNNRLNAMTARLGSPERALDSRAQTLDYLATRLFAGLRDVAQRRRSALQTLQARLPAPRRIVEEKAQACAYLAARLERAGRYLITPRQDKLAAMTRMMHSLSPKGVLARGYALVYDEAGHLVRSSGSVLEGAALRIEFEEQDFLSVKAGKSLKT